MNNEKDSRSPSKENNEALHRLLTNDVYMRGDLNAIDNCVAPDYKDVANNISGPEGLKKLVPNIRSAFWGLEIAPLKMAANDEYIAAFCAVGGKQVGALMGAPATNRKVSWNTFELFQSKEGKFIAHWDVMHALKLSAQLKNSDSHLFLPD